MDIHIPRGLPSRQTRFLCLLAARPSLTRADYQRLIEVSHNTAQRDLAELLAAGLVLRAGRGPRCRYGLGPKALIPPPREPEHGADMGGQSVPNLTTVTISMDPLLMSRR
jgi:hypothetical protein